MCSIFRYLSPFELRPKVIDKEDSYHSSWTIHDDYSDINHHYSGNYYLDCYQIYKINANEIFKRTSDGSISCYRPICDFFSGKCAASWKDLDLLGNTTLSEATKDWDYYVGNHLQGIWGYAVATMVVFPLLLIWPIIHLSVMSETLSIINASPFFLSESWVHLFPTCNISIRPTAAYHMIYVSYILCIACFILPLFVFFLRVVIKLTWDYSLQRSIQKCQIKEYLVVIVDK